uniref:Uncharacterized protein n=1 Tax=Sphaerodactylus townsendi TaxID=933632 RepID=A0ACB8FSA1_9SAUR
MKFVCNLRRLKIIRDFIEVAHGLNHLCQYEIEYYNTTSTDICQEHVIISYNLTSAISAILLAVTVLEFLITITTACFGCASLCRNDYSEMTVVVFQKTEEGITPASALPRHMNEDVEA